MISHLAKYDFTLISCCGIDIYRYKVNSVNRNEQYLRKLKCGQLERWSASEDFYRFAFTDFTFYSYLFVQERDIRVKSKMKRGDLL